MKIYLPLNLEYPLDEAKVYGWIDKSSHDLFICSFSNPIWFPEFSDISIEECREIGSLSANFNEKSLKSLQLPDSFTFLNLNSDAFSAQTDDPSIVLIYYKICKDLSKSADFSNNFSSFPLKQIKWAAILNYNSDGQFLKLTKIQRFLSTSVSTLLSLKPVRNLIDFAQKRSLRSFSSSSSCVDQFFKKKDHLSEMYKFLLSNESVLSDTNRNLYRNALILTSSDIIFGSILLPEFLKTVQISFFKSFTIDFFEEYLDWFMGWPAGFKFNANLTKFLGKFFLALLAIWKVLVFPNLDINPQSVNALCNFKHFGLTFILGIISDFWSISTLHIHLFYQLTTKIYGFYCVLMLSLFRLFRGKKWNVLRNRVDRTDYTMDQLLVGMLLFSMLFCTFSTVTAYYLLFTASLLFSLSIKCSLESLAIILNTFPVYFLILKFSRNSLITNRFKLVPFELKTKTPSFVLCFESPKYSEIFAELMKQLLGCWMSVFNLENVYRILVGYQIETSIKN